MPAIHVVPREHAIGSSARMAAASSVTIRNPGCRQGRRAGSWARANVHMTGTKQRAALSPMARRTHKEFNRRIKRATINWRHVIEMSRRGLLGGAVQPLWAQERGRRTNRQGCYSTPHEERELLRQRNPVVFWNDVSLQLVALDHSIDGVARSGSMRQRAVARSGARCDRGCGRRRLCGRFR